MRLNRVRVIPGRGCVCGVVGCGCGVLPDTGAYCCVSGSGLGWSAGVGESPVREDLTMCADCVPE